METTVLLVVPALPTFLTQIGLMMILGAITTYCAIVGIGDWFFYDRRWRGSVLLLLGLCVLNGTVYLATVFASQ